MENIKPNISLEKVKLNSILLYTQASFSNISKILKIKNNFPNLSAKKIHKMINDSSKVKPKINMTTKGSSRKQIIVPMGNNNKSKFITLLSMHITNLNSVLKNIKLDVMADFICIKQYSIIITTNKVISPLDLQTIEKYMKNIDYIDSDDIEIPFFLNSTIYYTAYSGRLW